MRVVCWALLIFQILVSQPSLGQEVTEDFTVVEPLDDIPPPPIGVEEVPPPLEIPPPEGMDQNFDGVDPAQSFSGWEDPNATTSAAPAASAIQDGPVVFRRSGKKLADPSAQARAKLDRLKSLQHKIQSEEGQ